MSESVQPLGDRVLVETIIEEQTIGGVLIPQMAQGRPERARVLAVGPGAVNKEGIRVPVPLEVGDVIYFHRLGGVHVHVADKELDRVLILRESDCLARVLDPDLD